ncbi:hypothetical protein C8T65DRAFT_698470 [Cerioporus squamosus]|nr:hypothetical protein C8T65DRAFT_698470 [Cerioporus squamosus]
MGLALGGLFCELFSQLSVLESRLLFNGHFLQRTGVAHRDLTPRPSCTPAPASMNDQDKNGPVRRRAQPLRPVTRTHGTLQVGRLIQSGPRRPPRMAECSKVFDWSNASKGVKVSVTYNSTRPISSLRSVVIQRMFVQQSHPALTGSQSMTFEQVNQSPSHGDLQRMRAEQEHGGKQGTQQIQGCQVERTPEADVGGERIVHGTVFNEFEISSWRAAGDRCGYTLDGYELAPHHSDKNNMDGYDHDSEALRQHAHDARHSPAGGASPSSHESDGNGRRSLTWDRSKQAGMSEVDVASTCDLLQCGIQTYRLRLLCAVSHPANSTSSGQRETNAPHSSPAGEPLKLDLESHALGSPSLPKQYRSPSPQGRVRKRELTDPYLPEARRAPRANSSPASQSSQPHTPRSFNANMLPENFDNAGWPERQISRETRADDVESESALRRSSNARSDNKGCAEPGEKQMPPANVVQMVQSPQSPAVL